jgi:hypothetical protein
MVISVFARLFNPFQLYVLSYCHLLRSIEGSGQRGGCRNCGMLGHLTFQCRNPKASDIDKESEVGPTENIYLFEFDMKFYHDDACH